MTADDWNTPTESEIASQRREAEGLAAAAARRAAEAARAAEWQKFINDGRAAANARREARRNRGA